MPNRAKFRLIDLLNLPKMIDCELTMCTLQNSRSRCFRSERCFFEWVICFHGLTVIDDFVVAANISVHIS